MKVGIFGSNFCHRTALVKGTHISKIFEIGPAVPDIWPFLDFGHKMRLKLEVLKKISIFHQNYISFHENYMACQNQLLNVFSLNLSTYRVCHLYLWPEIRPNNKVLVCTYRF